MWNPTGTPPAAVSPAREDGRPGADPQPTTEAGPPESDHPEAGPPEASAADGAPEVELTGGGVNRVVRIGETVRRPTGRWTPAVHALLERLEAAGFSGAPRVHGVDARGREILDHLPGEVSQRPLPDGEVAALGRLVRGFHDATRGFSVPRASWYFPPREPVEVVCHGDIALYNCVRRDGRPVALIDFDTAHPGPRVWDVAYAAYRCVPLSTEADPSLDVARQASRLRLLADGYRLGAADRAALVETAVARLTHLVDHMRTEAAAGHPAFASHLADGHDRLYEADIAHLRRHAGVLTAALEPR